MHNVLIDFVSWTFLSWTNFGKIAILIILVSPVIKYERKG